MRTEPPTDLVIAVDPRCRPSPVISIMCRSRMATKRLPPPVIATLQRGAQTILHQIWRARSEVRLRDYEHLRAAQVQLEIMTESRHQGLLDHLEILDFQVKIHTITQGGTLHAIRTLQAVVILTVIYLFQTLDSQHGPAPHTHCHQANLTTLYFLNCAQWRRPVPKTQSTRSGDFKKCLQTLMMALQNVS